MKKIPVILIMLFPYIFALLIYQCLHSQSQGKAIVWLVLAMAIMGLTVISEITTIIFLMIKGKIKNLTFVNLIIKVVYIPIHVLLNFLILAMCNPWLIWVTPILFIANCFLKGITGTMAVSGLVKLYKTKVYKLSTAIILGILSYCEIVDLIIAIVIDRKSRLID